MAQDSVRFLCGVDGAAIDASVRAARTKRRFIPATIPFLVVTVGFVPMAGAFFRGRCYRGGGSCCTARVDYRGWCSHGRSSCRISPWNGWDVRG